jgi:hypothetical protein
MLCCLAIVWTKISEREPIENCQLRTPTLIEDLAENRRARHAVQSLPSHLRVNAFECRFRHAKQVPERNLLGAASDAQSSATSSHGFDEPDSSESMDDLH